MSTPFTILPKTLTGAIAAVGEITGLEAYNQAVFVISGLTSETVSVTGNINGSVYTGDLAPIDLGTGAPVTATTLANGSYQIDNLCLRSLKFTKSSTSETVTITVGVK